MCNTDTAMTRYAILLNPGHNRTYYDASRQLSVAELSLVNPLLSCECRNITVSTYASVPYLTFDTSSSFTDVDLTLIAQLSFVFAIFEVIESEGAHLLKPVSLPLISGFSSDLNSILKYSGKTNELFTRLLINTAIWSSDFDPRDKLDILDPVAGKGTTLFEGLLSGHNVYGIEIHANSAHDCAVFLKKFLENSKHKHQQSKQKLSGKDKSFTAEINSIAIAKDKTELANGNTFTFAMVTGDTRHADKYFKREQFHAIAGDLPYGIQHGNVTSQKGASRNPAELVAASLSAWKHCLKRGGAIALSWNTHLLPRQKLEEIFIGNGLTPLTNFPYDSFSHRVDNSIKRDIFVAKKL